MKKTVTVRKVPRYVGRLLALRSVAEGRSVADVIASAVGFHCVHVPIRRSDGFCANCQLPVLMEYDPTIIIDPDAPFRLVHGSPDFGPWIARCRQAKVEIEGVADWSLDPSDTASHSKAMEQ